jgi:hypothetical protein
MEIADSSIMFSGVYQSTHVFSEYYNFEGRLVFCPLEQCCAK